MLNSFFIEEHVKRALEEDIGFGDITTDYLTNEDDTMKCELNSRVEGVLCGKNVFEMLHFFFARHGKYLCFLADSCVFMLAHSVIRKQLDLFGNTARGKVFFYPL